MRNRKPWMQKSAGWALLFVLHFALVGYAFEFEFSPGEAPVRSLTGEEAQEPLGDGIAQSPLMLGAPSPVTAEDNHFFIYLNTKTDSDNGIVPNPDQTDCDPADGSGINDDADCYSITAWGERTVDALLQYTPFRNWLQITINEMLDDPDDGVPTPFMDEALALPLFGDMNIGLFIQDLWDDDSAGGGFCGYDPATQTGTDSWPGGPRLIAVPARRIGCKYGDSNTEAIDVDELLGPGFTFQVWNEGPYNPGSSLGASSFEGSAIVDVQFPQFDVDLVFRQPPSTYATNVSSGYYLHGAGKARLSGMQAQLRIFTMGGNLRKIFDNASKGQWPGYGVGLDFKRLYLKGDLDLDFDAFHCGDVGSGTKGRAANADTLRFPINDPACDVDYLTSDHEDVGASWTVYRDNTDNLSKISSEIVKFIEAGLVYDAVRTADPAITQYLTALEVLDLQQMTHEITNNTVYSPGITHPLNEAETIYFDYGLFWRFDALNTLGDDTYSTSEGMLLPGGFGLDVTYSGGSECLTGNPIPSWADRKIDPVTPDPAIQFEDASVGDQAGGPDAKTAMFGFGVHQDPVNWALDRLWSQQILCLSMWKNTPLVGELLGDFLTGEGFSMFLPTLDRDYYNRDMLIRVVPRYLEPGNSDLTTFDKNVDQPKVVYNPGDPTNLPDGTKFSDGPEEYHGPYDMMVHIPHLEFQFMIDANGYQDPYTSFTTIFSIETDLKVYLGLGWWKVDSQTLSTIPTDAQSTVCGQSPYPCRVLRVSAFVDPTVNAFYDSLYDTTTYLEPDGLQNAVSSLIALLLDGVFSGYFELGLNTSTTDFLGITIDPADRVSGPYTWNATDGYDKAFKGNVFEPMDLDGDLNDEFMGFYFKFGDLYGQPQPDGSRTTGSDGYADELSPELIMLLMEEFGLTELSPAYKGNDPMLTGVGTPSHASPETFWDLPDHGVFGTDVELSPNQVAALGLDGTSGAVLTSSGWSAEGSEDNLRYQYRVDGGHFQTRRTGVFRVPFLLEGKHTIESWAIDREGYLDPVPASLSFVVDRTAPEIAWRGDTNLVGRNGRISLGINVVDNYAPAPQLDVAWRIDQGEWQSIEPTGLIDHRLAHGPHTLEVRAVDAHGNEEIAQLEFTAEPSSGFGCSAGYPGGDIANVLTLLLAIAGALLLRRRNDTTRAG